MNQDRAVQLLAILERIKEAAKARWGPKAVCDCPTCLDRRRRAAERAAWKEPR